MLGGSKEGRRAASAKQVAASASSEFRPNEASRFGVVMFGLLMAVLGLCAGTFAAFPLLGFGALGVGAALAALLAYSFRIAAQWERVVIMRFGKFNRIAKPGLYVVVPFIEYAAIRVDQRVMISTFSAEAALTADLVPVDIDAVIFWVVWDVRKASFEVENYPKAVLLSAQTALRDAIGKQNIAELSMRRDQINKELQAALEETSEPWGITVSSVEVKDIAIPEELQDALSREAQAEREKSARVALAEVELEVSEMLVEAADVYDRNPRALRLRSMNLAYESTRGGKGVLLAPSSLAAAFADEKAE